MYTINIVLRENSFLLCLIIFKSPIIFVGLELSGTKISDFVRSNPKKAKTTPLGTVFINWCAIVCDYRTNHVQEYKKLGVKIDEILPNFFCVRSVC